MGIYLWVSQIELNDFKLFSHVFVTFVFSQSIATESSAVEATNVTGNENEGTPDKAVIYDKYILQTFFQINKIYT